MVDPIHLHRLLLPADAGSRWAPLPLLEAEPEEGAVDRAQIFSPFMVFFMSVTKYTEYMNILKCLYWIVREYIFLMHC